MDNTARQVNKAFIMMMLIMIMMMMMMMLLMMMIILMSTMTSQCHCPAGEHCEPCLFHDNGDCDTVDDDADDADDDTNQCQPGRSAP